MRILLIISMVSGVLSSSMALAAATEAVVRVELKLERAMFGEREFELSGMAPSSSGFILISDNDDDTALYGMREIRSRFLISGTSNLTKLEGFDELNKKAKEKMAAKEGKGWLDLEGIATCGSDEMYFANERIRAVWKVTGKRIQELSLDWAGVTVDPWLGEANAGFEGIAVDCAAQHLYLAKERDPRRLYKFDLKTLKLLKEGDIPLSDRQGQKVINWRTGNGLVDLSPDFADLYFHEGFLYVLERNTYEIAKVEPNEFKMIARVSYLESGWGLYDSSEPYGMAEALNLEGKRIIIGYDNGDSALSHVTSLKYSVKGVVPAIQIFSRPDGF
jgi:hypothetical protein